MSRHALQKQPEFFQAEGFGDVVIRPIPHRLDRRLYGSIAGDHDYERLGAMFPDGLQGVQSPSARQLQVEQDHVRSPAVEYAVGLLGRLGHVWAEAQRLGYGSARLADGAVIIHNQQVQEIRPLDLRRPA
jgi:hypothetical protein